MSHQKFFVLVLFSLSCFPGPSHAANLTTATNQAGGTDWTYPIWQTNATGVFVSATAGNTCECLSNGIAIGNNLNETRLRTPMAGGFETFAGDSLTMDTNTEIRMKTAGSILNFPSVGGNPGLILKGGLLNAGDTGAFAVTGIVQVASQSYLCPGNNDALSVDGNRYINFAGQLTGGGKLVLFEGGTSNPNQITGTSNTFSGQWIVKCGWLQGVGTNSLGTNSITVDPKYILASPPFDVSITNAQAGPAVFEINYDLNSAGVLTLTNGGQMKLHQNCTFAAVNIEGSSLSLGTYSYSLLNATFPANFPAGGSGSITVHPPILCLFCPPTITTPPLSQTRYPGQTAQFSVVATGTLPLFYQWLAGATNSGVYTNLTDRGQISGSTNTTLTITNVGPDNQADYLVTIANAWGVVTSSVATLTVSTSACSYASAVLSNQPVAYYQLNETGDPGTGNLTAADALGLCNGTYGPAVLNGFNGISGPCPPTWPGFETNNTAASFSRTGTNAQINLPALNFNTNTVTIAAWIYPSNVSQASWSTLFQFRTVATACSLQYGANPPGNLTFNWNNNSQTYSWNSGLVPPANQWSFAALVVTPTDGTIYLFTPTGTSKSTLSVANAAVAFNGSSFIGNDPSGSFAGTYNFTGRIDDLVVFNYALSPAQLQTLFDIGSGLVAPRIFTQPVSLTLAGGQTAQFGVSATGSGPLSYQWQAGAAGSGVYTNLADGSNISGSASSTLTISNTAPWNAADYVVVVSGPAGAVTSSAANLTLLWTNVPQIWNQPASLTINAGQVAQLAVGASGLAPLSYQWQAGASGSGVFTNLSDGGQISGSATATLTFSNVAINNAGDYLVVVANSLGSVTSSVARLTVLPSAPNVVESASVRVTLTANPFSFNVVEKATGMVLLQQTANQFTFGSTYTVSSATNLLSTATTLDADLTFSGTPATAHIQFNFIQPQIVQVTLSSGNNPTSIFQQFADQGEDMFGALETPFGGTLSARGYSWQLKGGNGVSGIDQACGAHAPFYLTTRHYGIYAESQANGTLTFAQGGYTSFSFPVPQLTYDIIYATDYATIMAGFNSRTVPSYLPPTWAFDPIWWMNDPHYNLPAGVTNAQGNVVDVGIQLTNHQIHASAEWIDQPYGTSCGQGEGHWGNMDFDSSSFPNPPQMIGDLHARGLNLMLWITDLCWCNLYNEAYGYGYLFYTNSNSTVNLQNTNAYYWFQTNLNVFVNLGVMGYKIDRGDQGEMPDSVQNTNDILFAQLAYNGLAAVYPANCFVFTRSVSDIGRQYTAIWNGDTAYNLVGLQYSIIAGLRAGILNFPMWGSDTGGYLIIGNKPSEGVFDRWFEFSAYCPIMEVLVGDGRTPWYDYSTNFTSPTNIVAIAAAQAGTHHDLIPYTRSWLYQATQTGMPVLRPIMFGYPNDTNEAVTITNCEYLYGPSLLVAPVIVSNAVSRSVHLPADQWLDYNGKSNLYTGPANITAAAPITMIPVFVNQGAIIPRGDIFQGNNLWTSNWAPYLRIEFFPSESSGSSFPYYTGSAVQIITATNQNHTLTIRFGNLGYSGNLQVYLESLGSVAGTVTSNGVALASGAGYTYNATTHLLQVPFNGATTLVVSDAGSLFSPLEAWRIAHFGNPSDPSVSGDGADPDGDGIPNFWEYAFGLDPLTASTNGLPFRTTVNVSGTNYLALTFQRATNATDCTFTVLVTSNLVGQLSQWLTGSSYSGANIISNTANTTEVSRVLSNNVEVITVRDNVPMSAAPQGFMTVRVTSP